ncbi:hypothetical protein [Flavobacterium gyeonganense]|uniref:Uncharacterized protein n=1 Tax=Flavobacterium gyeonganense TaxID=1310418 RepID=A0ABV5H6K8_9FLAO|nr:hypothetical protein [Flavobacterium gyeonganense]
MSKRLPTEFAINMSLDKIMIIQQPELKFVSEFNYFDENSPCHIYFICKKPRLTIIPEKFEASDEYLKMTFGINRKGVIEEKEYKFANNLESKDIQIVSSYPFNIFQLKSNDEVLVDAKVSPFLQTYASGDFLNLEVLYIGQSYGVDGARTAPDRLVSHSTLQGIYAEAIINNPDSEIYLALASFSQINFVMMDGRTKFSNEELKEDDIRRKKVSDKLTGEGINEQQRINFTEAALIKYFQPRYNKIYKDSFPNPAHLTYSECYELDINAVCIELQTYEMINCCFYSDEVKPAPWNMHYFLLNSQEERKSIFEII